MKAPIIIIICMAVLACRHVSSNERFTMSYKDFPASEAVYSCINNFFGERLAMSNVSSDHANFSKRFVGTKRGDLLAFIKKRSSEWGHWIGVSEEKDVISLEFRMQHLMPGYQNISSIMYNFILEDDVVIRVARNGTFYYNQ